MREIERPIRVGRRGFLRGAATTVPAAALASAGMGITAEAAWAQAAKTLQPRHHGDAGPHGARHLSARPLPDHF